MWQKINTCDLRCLLLLPFLLQVIFASPYQLVVPQIQVHEHKISDNNDTVFVRQLMRRAKSAEMRNYMNQEADACDNFYEYACGNWAQIHPANNGAQHSQTNFFETLSNTYNLKLLNLLKEGIKKNDTEFDKKAKQFYASCHNLRCRQQNREYRANLRDIIKEFGSMPALMPPGTWQEEDFDWLATIAKIQNKYGLDIILGIGIRQDFVNNTVNKLFVGQPILKLQSKTMYWGEGTKWYRDYYMQDIVRNLGRYLDLEEDRAIQTAKQILDFERQLAKGIADKRLGKTLKSETKLRTLEEMAAIYEPTINFTKFINTGLGMEINGTFYEYMLDYQVNLVEVIKATPKEHVANYIMYQLVQVFFYNAELPTAAGEKLCLEKTKIYFAKILDNIIFRKYNNEGTERDINLIWQKLKETFKVELESKKLSWMSAATRQLAIEKLEAMQLEINSYQNVNLTAAYEEVTISSDYLNNVKQIRVFETKRVIKSLFERPKPIEAALLLSYSPAYIGTENLIKIPVSLLQPNFLWSDYYPNALKFGTLGYLVAHELIHGFDDIGRNLDISGKEITWWDNSSTEAFDERKKCFKRQYARYRYGGKYLPESELQAENIADNGAIQIAYSAYQKWLESVNYEGTTEAGKKRGVQTEALPNMNYTHRQLFFLSFAQFWCNDVNDRFKDKVTLIDMHAPSMFRVIGPLANFDEFSKQFNCPIGTTMNPAHKCQIY